MNKNLNDLFQISLVINNNCPDCDDIFFLPSRNEVDFYKLSAKTPNLELLRTGVIYSYGLECCLLGPASEILFYDVNHSFAVRPEVCLNLPQQHYDKTETIGKHKVILSLENSEHFITIEDLGVPKEFIKEPMSFKRLYFRPASEFKPAKFKILNWGCMQNDGHILAILDQPLTCLHYGEDNRYVNSYVRQQLELLPDLMFEKALEMQQQTSLKSTKSKDDRCL